MSWQWSGRGKLTGLLSCPPRKLAVFDTWSSLAVHIAMDNTVVMEEISKWLTLSAGGRVWGMCFPAEPRKEPCLESPVSAAPALPVGAGPRKPGRGRRA